MKYNPGIRGGKLWRSLLNHNRNKGTTLFYNRAKQLKIYIFYPESGSEVIVHMTYVIEGSGAQVIENGEEQPIKAGDFALVSPDEKQQYRNKGNIPNKLICGETKEFD